MEFMATYGWAILLVVVVIGTLSYFFFFNPNNAAANECIFFPGIACTDVKISESTGVTLTLDNGFKKSLPSFDLSISGCNTTSAINGLDVSETEIITLPCNGLAHGDRIKLDVTANYVVVSGGMSLDHKGYGQIVGIVEQ